MPVQSQYIFSLLLHVVKNSELFRPNSDVRNIKTRYNSDFHSPIGNLTVFQREFLIFDLEFVTNFHQLKDLSYDVKHFKLALKRIFLANTFSCLKEYFDWR